MPGIRREVRIFTPAKVNLILRILDRRPDGYHNLWSLLHTVSLEDELHVRLHHNAGVTLECDDPTLPTDGRNLVARAAGIVLERARLAVGLRIRIVKRIPVSAGLGGGSSDAAATIVALNRLLDLGWSASDMAKVGQVLGSDVPFFFFAPTAYVRGRGEEVYPFRLTGRRWIVLVNPGFPIHTRWAYDRLASIRSTIRPLSPAITAISGATCVSWDEVVPMMENDFEDALASTHPILSEIRTALRAKGAEVALLSGSGATVFGVFRDEGPAVRARDEIASEHRWWASAVRAGSDSLLSQENPREPLPIG
jgi:4-diphosphocytidyl-2-C-methyl-D-erythritol kinase